MREPNHNEAAVRAPREEEIAVVGLACRFPEAPTPEAFWKVLAGGIETIADLDEAALRTAGVPEDLLANPAYVRRGAKLGGIEDFDPGLFGYSPNEAALLDPQIRLFLECASEVLDSSGFAGRAVDRDIGVFGGVGLNTYYYNNLANNPEVLEDFGFFQTMIANDKDYLATLASYKLDLTGPGVTVQTACSTSLVAVHMACQSLLSGECDLAMAGGANLSVPEVQGYLFQEGMIYSPDGSCRPFSADAAGTTNGAGCGVVLLQPLADALQAGATIHAIIRGSAINNDGARRIGYTAPGLEGQARVITEAQRVAGVEPGDIGYVEAHGTATPLGDSIEVAALSRAWRGHEIDHSGQEPTCFLGSLKSNMGHAGSAAGVAGLIKTVLTVGHDTIPPTLHFNRPHPEISLAGSPFRVNDSGVPWPQQGAKERIAGVSSFGIGGTNAHVIVAQNRFPAPSPPKGARPVHLLPLSAHTPAALDTARKALAGHLRSHPELEPGAVAHTLQTGRRQFAHRMVVTGTDLHALAQALEGRNVPVNAPRAAETRRVAFMMTGHGSQSPGMASRLLEQEPAFRAAFAPLADRLLDDTGIDAQQILTDSDLSRVEAELTRMAVSQPLMYIIQLSLVALWRSWGIKPEIVLGHSSGEFAAAAVAGVFDEFDGLKLVIGRGRLMDQTEPGGMIALPFGERELERFLEPGLSVAVVNGPDLCVVSGAEAPLQRFSGLLDERGVDHRRLDVSRAAHSATMEAVQSAFAEVAAGIKYTTPRLPYLCSVTGGWSDGVEITRPDYWVRHLRAPVRFGQAVACIADDPDMALVEIGPGHALSTFAQAAAEARPPLCVPSLGRLRDGDETEDQVMAASLGQLWSNGVAVDWPGFREGQFRHLVPLPTTPFQRRRCWFDATPSARGPKALPLREPDPSKWFHQPGWRRAEPVMPTGGTKELPRRILLLRSEKSSLCDALQERLSQMSGVSVLPVLRGMDCRIDAEGAEIRPDRPEDYERLCRAFEADLVVHAWTCEETAPDAGNRPCDGSGFVSLCLLGKAMGQRPQTPADILVVAGAIFDVTGSEILDPLRAKVLGPVKVIPQEFPHLRTCLLDVADPAETGLGDCLASLVMASQRPPVLAFRAGHRWVPDYRKMVLPDDGPALRTLRDEGVYVITGGLGGLGMTIAEHLARTCRARLVLIGRNAPDGPADWHMEAAGMSVDRDTLFSRLRAMEAHGAQVRPIAADCADGHRLADIFETARSEWGRIDGVVHAAGSIGTQLHNPLDSFSMEQADDQFRSKIAGTRALEAAIGEDEPDFVILMSSMASVFGGLGFAAYTAANAYLDAVAARHSRHGNAWLSLNWDRWVPAGQEFVESASPVTMAGIEMSPTQGLGAFLRALGYAHGPQVMITPGDIGTRLAQWIELGPRGGEEDADSPCLDDGIPDAMAPSGTGSGLTPGEAALAEIWQRLLGYASIGPDDHFFDLGGHSLLATRLLAQIHRRFGAAPSLKALFDNPTLKGLAAAIERAGGRMQTGSAAQQDVQEYGSEGGGAASGPNLAGHAAPTPLTQAQKQLWIVQQSEPQAQLYNVPVVLRLRGALQVDLLHQALTKLVARHQALRLYCYVHEGEPVQGFAAELPVDLPVIETDPAEMADAIARESAARFDLRRAPLFRARLLRAAPDDHTLVMVFHHITIDGWSVGLLLGELSRLYDALVNNRPSGLPEPAVDYIDHARSQAAQLDESEIARQLAYWESTLDGLPVRHALPGDRPLPDQRSFASAIVRRDIPAGLTQEIRAFASTQGTSLFMVLLAAFGGLLYRLTGVEDQPVITSSAHRKHEWQESIVGLFVAMLVLRLRPTGGETFRELVSEARRVSLEAFSHADVPLLRLVERLNPPRHPGQHPLTQIGFVVQNMPFDAAPPAGLELDYSSGGTGTCQYDLLCAISESGDHLQVDLEYGCELFDRETVECFADGFLALLADAVRHPDQTLATLHFLSPEQERTALAWSMARERDGSEYGRKTFVDLVRERAQANPDAPALIHEEVTSSYRELISAQEALSAAMIERGVGNGDIVAVHLPRGPERIVAFLAIMATGAAYLPLDPMLPQERLDTIRRDARPAVEITAQGIVDCVSGEGPSGLGDFQADAAYVIYTSGSTGMPKGVVLGHPGLTALALSQRGIFEVGPGDRVLQLAAPSFDAWIWEVALALGGGAALVTAPEEALRPGPELLGLLRESRITHVTITPPALSALPYASLPELRVIIAAGAALPAELGRLWAAGRSIYNAYGPTETTVCASVGLCDPEQDRFDIGRPLPGLSAHVLDRDGNLLPAGIPGELCVGGIGLALGYLNRPELTAERFVPNPVPGAPHPRLYRTGDRAMFRRPRADIPPDLVFLGRLDDQLELRGYRVEPAEVEHCLCLHESVAEAAVVGFPRDHPDRLVAYVVAKAEPCDASTLREHAARHLPAYMVPSFVIAVERLPLTVAGKLDLSRLPAPAAPGKQSGQGRPRNATEETLCRIWQETLAVGKVDVETSFFDAGGTSLLAVRLAAAIRETFGTELPLPVLFNHPTVAALARLLKPEGEPLPSEPVETVSAPTVPADGGTGPSSFWFPGLAGHAMGLGPLASRLADVGPVHTLLLRGADGRNPPDRSLDAALARQVETIRRLQPHGPYRLGGHSLGGKLAWMVAEILTNDGEIVERLCILDGIAPDVLAAGIPETPGPSALLCWLVAELAGTDLADPGFAGDDGSYETLRSRALAYLQETTALTMNAADLDALVRSTTAILPLILEPVAAPPTPLAIPTLVVAATVATGEGEPPIARIGPDLGWLRFVAAPRCHTVEATHAGLLVAPHVDRVSRLWHDFVPSETF